MPVTSLKGTGVCPQSVDVQVGSGRCSIGPVVSWMNVLASMIVLSVANFV